MQLAPIEDWQGSTPSLKVSLFSMDRTLVAVSTYPGAENYLVTALSKIGKVTVPEKHTVRNTGIVLEGWLNIDLQLSESARQGSWEKGFLKINKDTGACLDTGHIKVRFQGKSWRDLFDRGECQLQFDLSLSTQFVPIEQHDAEMVREGIRSFIEQLQRGVALI